LPSSSGRLRVRCVPRAPRLRGGVAGREWASSQGQHHRRRVSADASSWPEMPSVDRDSS